MLLEDGSMPVRPPTGQLALLPPPDPRESVRGVWGQAAVSLYSSGAKVMAGGDKVV